VVDATFIKVNRKMLRKRSMRKNQVRKGILREARRVFSKRARTTWTHFRQHEEIGTGIPYSCRIAGYTIGSLFLVTPHVGA
jgi:hypothetical protein